jgi:hypothetical protein
MPVEIHISDDNIIVVMKYIDPWTVQDLMQTFPTAKTLCDQAQHELSILVDLRGTVHLPPGVLRARESPLLKSPRVKRVAAVGGPAYVRVLGDAVLRLVNFKGARFFEHIDDAMAYLQHSGANTRSA